MPNGILFSEHNLHVTSTADRENSDPDEKTTTRRSRRNRGTDLVLLFMNKSSVIDDPVCCGFDTEIGGQRYGFLLVCKSKDSVAIAYLISTYRK